MPKTTCPRCGHPKATANAQGPDYVYCKKCGGLVPVKSEDEDTYIHADPVRNAIAKEAGHDQVGVKRTSHLKNLRGGK